MMHPKQKLTCLLLILLLAGCQDQQQDGIPGYVSTSNAAPRSAARDAPQVVLYATSWCGYCRRAREYLTRNGVEYVEYDIETSAEGRRQFTELRGTGVPLILVGTQEIRGWNPQALKAALARAGIQQRPAPEATRPAVPEPTPPAAADDGATGYSAVTFITPSSEDEHRYIIHLRDKRTLKVDEHWEDGDEIKYKKFGGTIGVPRSDVVMIEDTVDGTTTRYTQP